MDYQWITWIIHGYSWLIHGYPWIIHEYPWIILGRWAALSALGVPERVGRACVRVPSCPPARGGVAAVDSTWLGLVEGFVTKKISMDVNGDPWISRYVHGCPWIAMDIHEYPRIPLDIRRYPKTSMDIHGYHGYPQISMNIHGCPWISMYPWISMDIH